MVKSFNAKKDNDEATKQHPLCAKVSNEKSAWDGFSARSLQSSDLLRRPLTNKALWLVGQLDRDRPRIGVVGARRACRRQLHATTTLCKALVDAGAVIVSGGAVGVDTEAHYAALRHNGNTVVCLPAGVGHGGGSHQYRLCKSVLANGGAVVSCEPPQSGHHRAGYRRRNAVIVALVDALVVVCGGAHSGTLITAAMADRANLPRRAIPWSPGIVCSAGSNDLLANGWHALSRFDDGKHLLQTLLGQDGIDVGGRGWQRYAPLEPRSRSSMHDPTGNNSDLVSAIEYALAEKPDEGLSLEELINRVGKERSQLAPLLLQLRMTGQIQCAPFGRYVRCR